MAELIRERRNDVLERHIQTIITTLILGSVIWAGSTLQRLQEAIVRQEERTIAMQTDMARMDKRVGAVESQVQGLDRRVDRLERSGPGSR